MSKKKRRKRKRRHAPHVAECDANMSEAIKRIFAKLNAGGLALVIEREQTAWFPVFPDWSGMEFDSDTGKVVVALNLNNLDRVKMTLAFLHSLSRTAGEIRDQFATIATDLERATGLRTIFEEDYITDEVPSPTDVN
jgi:hypothetical protein